MKVLKDNTTLKQTIAVTPVFRGLKVLKDNTNKYNVCRFQMFFYI